MKQKEGVIKFSLDYTPSEPLPHEALRELNAWRKVCHLCGLIGQDPDRYGGYGYGNISQRLTGGRGAAFIISGSQTGRLEHLSPDDYALVTECIPTENHVVARGPSKPSSESLTHGAVYALDAGVGGVIHAHSPDIWRQARALGIALTNAAVPYGTPELADEIGRLLATSDARQRGIVAMGGHEDGIIAFGTTLAKAGLTLVRTLALAFELE
jgi:L-ribulose-5-phosphate 4-epimerase